MSYSMVLEINPRRVVFRPANDVETFARSRRRVRQTRAKPKTGSGRQMQMDPSETREMQKGAKGSKEKEPWREKKIMSGKTWTKETGHLKTRNSDQSTTCVSDTPINRGILMWLPSEPSPVKRDKARKQKIKEAQGMMGEGGCQG